MTKKKWKLSKILYNCYKGQGVWNQKVWEPLHHGQQIKEMNGYVSDDHVEHSSLGWWFREKKRTLFFKPPWC